MKHFKLTTSFSDPSVVIIDEHDDDLIDDATNVYGDTCDVNRRGCLYLTQCGVTACVHCGRRAT